MQTKEQRNDEKTITKLHKYQKKNAHSIQFHSVFMIQNTEENVIIIHTQAKVYCYHYSCRKYFICDKKS